MSEKKKTDKTDKSNDTNSWIENHDLVELVETTNLNILPKYDMIPENDLTTSRKVVICELPKSATVEKDGQILDLNFITISDNNIKYSLPFNSKALQRSFIAMAIKESKALNYKDIDFSKIIGKMVGLKREQFTAKGFTQAPLKFFRLDK